MNWSLKRPSSKLQPRLRVTTLEYLVSDLILVCVFILWCVVRLRCMFYQLQILLRLCRLIKNEKEWNSAYKPWAIQPLNGFFGLQAKTI